MSSSSRRLNALDGGLKYFSYYVKIVISEVFVSCLEFIIFITLFNHYETSPAKNSRIRKDKESIESNNAHSLQYRMNN